MRTVTYHSLCTLFPLVEGRDFEDMVEDIRAHGLLEPIWTLGASDVVLDGRNRHRACLEAKVEPVFREWPGTEDEAVYFVLSQNLHRRHLNTSQRAVLAARVMPLLRAHAQKRQEASQSQPGEKIGTRKAPPNPGAPSKPGRSRHQGEAASEAARLTGVGRESVRKAEKVQEHGSEELKEATAAGRVSVHRAAQLADLPAEQQAEAIQTAQTQPRTPERDPAKVREQLERTVKKLRWQAAFLGLTVAQALAEFPEKPEKRPRKPKRT